MFVVPRVSPSCWLLIAIAAADRMFRAEQSSVPLIYGITVVCAIPASVLIRTNFVGAASPQVKIVDFAKGDCDS